MASAATNGSRNVNQCPSDDQHERMLYNTFRFELHEIIKAYLQRTQQPYPIRLVFDFASVPASRL